MTTETTEATGVSELDAFKARVYEMAQQAKRNYGWCGEIDEILARLDIEAPASAIGEGPTEDGLYLVNDFTYFVIRYGGMWMHTALQESQRYTSPRPCTWAEIVAWVHSVLPGIPPERVAGSLVKVG